MTFVFSQTDLRCNVTDGLTQVLPSVSSLWFTAFGFNKRKKVWNAKAPKAYHLNKLMLIYMNKIIVTANPLNNSNFNMIVPSSLKFVYPQTSENDCKLSRNYLYSNMGKCLFRHPWVNSWAQISESVRTLESVCFPTEVFKSYRI